MNIRILTESQEEILNEPNNYTERDILDLSILSHSISALVQVMTVFLLYRDEREEDQGLEIPILNILSLLIKPIDRFLAERAPVAIEDKEEETKETA